MPYINDDIGRRREVCPESELGATNAGELNYQLTELIKDYIRTNGVSYQTFNDISGAFTECLAEFRRRIIVPYEVQKIDENGDVYGDF